MSSPPRSHARRASSATREGAPGSTRRTSGAGSGIPVPNTSLRASRLATTQPSYDFLIGNAAPTPVKPLGQTFRQSAVVKPDIGNEDLRAQIKTLQYECESLKQDREVTNLRHSKELRDAQLKAEEVFQKARAEDSQKTVPAHKYDTLNRELKNAQDQLINQKNALDKKARAAQENERSAREETEEAQNELASMDRGHKHQLQEIESKHATLQKTLSEVRDDLNSKVNTLRTTQDRLSLREAETGELESEILRLKAHTGDADTLGVIKRELSEQVAHIRKLEGTNREQGSELKHLRKINKAVEVVEEEKRVLESKLGLLDDAQKQLREAQLQRQILEDERSSWTSYLQNEGGSEGGHVEFSAPEEIAKALVRQRLENASLVQQKGELQAEQLEKDSMIKQLEDERNTVQLQLEQLKTTTGGTTSSSTGGAPTAAESSRTKQRLEKQLSFAKKEVALMREQLRSFDSEEQTYHPESKFDAAKSQRISDLEAMLDDHRRELTSLTSELSTLESTLHPAPRTPLKRSHADMEGGDESSLLGQLTRKNRTLQDTLTNLQSQHAILTSDHAALTTRLAQLQQSARTRVLSLRSNPTADHEALKLSTLTALRRENADLLALLETRPPSSSSSSGGPPPPKQSLTPPSPPSASSSRPANRTSATKTSACSASSRSGGPKPSSSGKPSSRCWGGRWSSAQTGNLRSPSTRSGGRAGGGMWTRMMEAAAATKKRRRRGRRRA